MTKWRIGRFRDAVVGLGYFARRLIAACEETGVTRMIDTEDPSI